MRLPDRTQAIVSDLSQIEGTEQFLLRFLFRDPPLGAAQRGNGALGMNGQPLLFAYLSGMKRLFSKLQAPPFSWPAPKTDKSGKTEVYITHLQLLNRSGEPYTAIDRDNVPYICLPCRSNEPVLQTALFRAETEAIHEATHAFCWTSRPPLRGVVEKKWRWFNEATAVFMEGHVAPDNPDSIRFGLDWADFPDISLDHSSAQYQSGFFAGYLARRFDPGLISRMWQESGPEETPLETLNRLIPRQYRSRSKYVCRIFGEYALDSYSVWDRESPGFAHKIFLRFSSRALTEGLVLNSAGAVTTLGELNHLACRYYRIEISSRVKQVEARIQMLSGSQEGFRAFLSVVKKQMLCRDQCKELQPLSQKSTARSPNPQGILAATISSEYWRDCESIILTVANCGTRAKEYFMPNEVHDDDRNYKLEIRASG